MLVNFKDSSAYDFSGNRVRFYGSVLSKFDICYHIDHINPNYVAQHCLYDVCKYTELSELLKSLLK